MSGLGLCLPLIDGEMPTSLVSRLSRLHGTSPRDFCSDMGLQWPHICSAHPEQLSRLAMLANVSLPQLIRWSGPLVSPCRYRVGHEIASTGVFRRAATRVCPRCVLESHAAGQHYGPFQRVEWLVLSIRVCADHGSALLKLPNAGHAHDTYDLLAQINRHNSAIQDAANAVELAALTEFEVYVRSRIHGQAAWSWLSNWELQHLHRGCLALGSALLFGSAENSASLDMARGRAALDRGYSALQGGPAQLLNALSELKSAFKTERPYFSTDIGDFYAWLKEEGDEPKLTEVRDTVRAFIIDSYPLRPDVRVLGTEVCTSPRMTFAKARQVSGIARARMKMALGHVHGKRQGSLPVITDVKVDDISYAEDLWASLSNLKDTADALDVHPAQIKSLIEAGVLEAVRLRSALRYVTKTSMAAVLDLINSLPTDRPSKQLLPIAEFCQSRCISMARVLKAVQGGEIRHVCRNSEAAGIRSILIDNGELPVRTRRRQETDMSIAEAAEHLQIGGTGIRALRDCGYLDQVRRKNPDTNHQRAFITIQSVERFEAEYETVGQMAVRMGIRPMHLAKQLDSAGVEPLPTKGSLVRAYLRLSSATEIKRN